MAKNEQGFFDWLVDDICNTIEIKGAVEATRDENGKVDKWAATGLAMGLGHTSDDELATLAGFLGAEGAFDDDNDDSAVFDDIYTPSTTSSYTSSTFGYMSEDEYERKKQQIVSSAKSNIGCTIAAAIVVFIGMMVGVGNGSGAIAVICLCLLGLFCWTAYYCSKQRDNDIQTLEREYTESKKRRKQEEEAKRKQEVAKKEFEALKNYAGTADFCTAINLVFKKAKNLFDQADKVCDMDEPSYNRELIENLLTFILYFAIKDCKITSKQKSATFDLAMCWCCIHSDFTGDMLFLEQHNDLTETLQKALDEIYSLITVAVHKSGQIGADMDFTKALCSMMILLGEEFDKQFTPRGLGATGVQVILKTARKAAQRVIDERLLDHDNADYDVNLPPISENKPTEESPLDEKTQAVFKDIHASMDDLKKRTPDSDEPAEDDGEEFEDTLIGTNLIYADDMKLLSEAGYDEFDLNLMEPEELKEAMEDAGVDTHFYDFD